MIVCLDTNIVIYLVEVNAAWTPKATARLASLRAAGDEVSICDAARLECLAKPFATGNASVQRAAGFTPAGMSPAARFPPLAYCY
jgi:hypothetical protein